ncbi:MAG TPA: type VI secretion system baseplate subunit TssK [Polyangiaceae bacterium]|nr:type VI secretion system baseplate subunit TssK [Polyangiaceae bacterium]
MTPKKPLWTEGLLVSQHHFQQQDRYHEALLRDRLRSVHHFDWGVIELEIDERALLSGHFHMKRFRAIWPDGTVIHCGEGSDEAAPEPRSFETAFTPDLTRLEVVAALPDESDVTGNVLPAGAVGARRYAPAVRNVVDANDGASPQEVDFARPTFRVLFGRERTEGFTVIRLAELVRTQAGQVIVRDNYVPPVLHLSAAPFLSSGLRRVTAAITTRQRQLASDRKLRESNNIEFHSTDARKFWLLHSLNGAIPLLSHLLDSPRAHPEEAYVALAQLVGQLCTFDPEADPLSIPKFNYLDMGDTFEVLFARVLSLLSGGVEQRYVEIPLEHRPDGMFIGRLAAPSASAELFVALKAPIADALVRERVPAVLKMASWNQIYDVVKQARHGVRVEIEWQPSGALPIRPGMCFFRVQKRGPYWDDIVKTQSLALYLPNETDWTNTSMSVYAVDPQFLK